MSTEKRLGYMAVDQYGTTHHLDGKFPRKQLLDIYGVTSAQKIYIDRKSGENSVHVGWIVSGHWFNVYQVFPLDA